MNMWSIQDTLTLVHDRYGPQQRVLAEPSLRAMQKRIGFAVFHTAEVLRHFNDSDANVLQGQDMRIMFDADLSAQHFQAQYAMAAHAMAAVENLYAVSDLLANAVFHSLSFASLTTSPFLTELDVNYANVLAEVRQLPRCGAVAGELNALKSAPAFQYLEALVEQSRHGAMVVAGMWFDVTGRDPETYRLKFPAFEHRGKPYLDRQVDPFLLDEGLRVQRTVEKTMRAVDVQLRNGA